MRKLVLLSALVCSPLSAKIWNLESKSKSSDGGRVMLEREFEDYAFSVGYEQFGPCLQATKIVRFNDKLSSRVYVSVSANKDDGAHVYLGSSLRTHQLFAFNSFYEIGLEDNFKESKIEPFIGVGLSF